MEARVQASVLGPFTFGERGHGTLSIGVKCASETVWTFRKREKSSLPTRIRNPDRPARSLDSLPTELSRLQGEFEIQLKSVILLEPRNLWADGPAARLIYIC